MTLFKRIKKILFSILKSNEKIVLSFLSICFIAVILKTGSIWAAIIGSISFCIPVLCFMYMLSEEDFSKIKIYIILGCILCFNGLYAWWFVFHSDTLYYWDQTTYWSKAIDLTQKIVTSPYETIKNVYSSTYLSDYTYFPVLFMIVPHLILGMGRESYVFVYSFFCISMYMLSMYILVQKIFCDCDKIYDNRTKKNFIIIFFTIILGDSAIFNPVFKGLPDIVGLIFIVVLLRLAYEFIYLKKITKKHIFQATVISILLSILAITRRWYICWIVGYGISSIITSVIVFIKNKNSKLEKKRILLWTLVGGISLGIMVVFFPRFVIKVINSNYSKMYVAYNADFFVKINSIIKQFGIFRIILAIFGVISSMVFEKKGRRFSFFIFIMAFIAAITFTRIQNFNTQHYYLLITAIEYFEICGVWFICNLFKKKLIRSAVIFLFVILFFITSTFSSILVSNKVLRNICGVVNEPYYMKSKENVLNMLNDVNKRIEQSEKSNGERVFLLSASNILNYTTVIRSQLPQKQVAYDNYMRTNDVDERDGVAWNMFLADYIIVCDPPQDKSLPNHQWIITIPSQKILAGDAGESLKLISKYKISDKINAYLYKKVKPFSEEFINEAIYEIKHKNINTRIDVIDIYGLNNITKKESYGKYGKVVVDKSDIKVHPDEQPTCFDVELNNKYSKLHFNIYSGFKDKVLQYKNPHEQAEINVSIYKDGQLCSTNYVTWEKKDSISIDVTNTNMVKIEINKGKFSKDNDLFTIDNFYLEK